MWHMACDRCYVVCGKWRVAGVGSLLDETGLWHRDKYIQFDEKAQTQLIHIFVLRMETVGRWGLIVGKKNNAIKQWYKPRKSPNESLLPYLIDSKFEFRKNVDRLNRVNCFNYHAPSIKREKTSQIDSWRTDNWRADIWRADNWRCDNWRQALFCKVSKSE